MFGLKKLIHEIKVARAFGGLCGYVRGFVEGQTNGSVKNGDKVLRESLLCDHYKPHYADFNTFPHACPIVWSAIFNYTRKFGKPFENIDHELQYKLDQIMSVLCMASMFERY